MTDDPGSQFDVTATPSKRADALPSLVQKLPARLGRYTLTRRLGVGGMAEVFLAQQDGPAGFRRPCVVKRILPHLAIEARFVAMFQREARLASMLTHTNIVQIIELGEEDGSYFIAMEYVDGAALHVLARTAWSHTRPLPLEVVGCAIADAALGLDHAHRYKDADGTPLGLIHRDISPDNLMINREGVTKILDFGIAKSVLSGERTATGELKGKIPFLSPEQLLSKPVDARADIYALGVTLYWLLTGRRPHVAPSDLLLMQKALHEIPVAPCALNPRVPDVVSDLTLKMLEKDPDRRPASAAEVHDTLAAALHLRRTVVVPFIDDALKLARPDDDDAIMPPTGFAPVVPSSVELEGEWFAAQATRPSVPALRPATSMPPTPSTSTNAAAAIAYDDAGPTKPARPVAVALGDVTVDDAALPAHRLTSPASGRGRLAAAALAGLVVVGGVAFAWTRDAPTATPPTTTAPTTTTPTATAPTATAPTTTAPTTTAPTTTAPTTAAPTTTAPTTAPTTAATTTTATPTTATPTTATPTTATTKAARPASVETRRTIRLTAPSTVQWQGERGENLGMGTRSVAVSSSTTRLVAIDQATGGHTSVTVADAINFSALPRGKVQARANPFANVAVGLKDLGTTPFPPIELPAGRYTFVFEHDGRRVQRVVDVKANETVRIAVDFAAP